jgi:hypothetical protein
VSEPVASVANLDPAETVHEGGGAPSTTAAPPKETVRFTGLDGDVVEMEKPKRGPGRPRGPAKAKPESEAAAATEATAAPTQEPPAQEPAKPPADDIPVPPELAQFRRRGEPAADFYARYSREQHARALKAEQRNDAILAEMAEMKQMLVPVYKAQWAAAKEAERQRQEEAMAAVPDREADPEAYRTALAEETLRRQLEWERKSEAEKAAALEERRQQEEVQRHLDSIAERDEGIAQERLQAIADPEVDRALQADLFRISQDWIAIFPNATDVQLEELTMGTHMQALIQVRDLGIPIADYYKHQAAGLQRAAALLMPQPEPAAPAGNGNGKPPATGSVVGAAVAKEATRAREAQALSGGGTPGRAGGIPGQVVNPLDFADDWQYAEFMMRQPKGTSDRLVKAAIAQQGAPGRR